MKCEICGAEWQEQDSNESICHKCAEIIEMEKNKSICEDCFKIVDHLSEVIDGVCDKCAQKVIKKHSCDFCGSLLPYDHWDEMYRWYEFLEGRGYVEEYKRKGFKRFCSIECIINWLGVYSEMDGLE